MPLNPPSLFPDIPASCIPATVPKERKSNSFADRNSKPDELDEFLRRDMLNLDTCVGKITNDNPDIACYRAEGEFRILSCARSGPVSAFAIFVVEETKQCSCYCGIKEVVVPFVKNGALTSVSQLNETINYLRQYELDDVRVDFVTRQIALLSNRAYTPSDYAVALQLRSKSSSFYEDLRSYLTLPSSRTIRSLVKNTCDADDYKYVSQFFCALEDRQRICSLLLDEIHVKPCLQYQGAVVFGEAANNSGSVATSMLAAMLSCSFGGPKHCIRLIPVCKLTAEYVVTVIRECCELVEKSGGKIIAVISDNYRVNRSAYSILSARSTSPWCTQSPVCPNRPLFLLSDPVHLLKNIRNNWLTEQSQEIEFFSGTSKAVARWRSLQNLFHADERSLVTRTSLTKTAVSPSPIERQNVKYVMQVFSESTVASLKLQGDLETAEFVQRVLNFWKICNVKAPNLDTRYNDRFRSVVYASDPWQLDYLTSFATFVESMAPSQPGKRIRTLTIDTSTAIVNTCHSLRELCIYLFDSQWTFVMLGNYSTDPLENLFGQFRQGCGGTYLVTVRALVEKHRINKTKLLSRLNSLFPTGTSDDAASAHSCDSCSNADLTVVDVLPLLADEISADVKEVLVYIAGYLSFKYTDVEDTYEEHAAHGMYLNCLNRGNLSIPPDSVVHFVYFMYVAFAYLSSDKVPCFTLVMKCAQHVCGTYGLILDSDAKAVCRSMCNILLNKYTRKYHTPTRKEPLIKQAKFSTK